MNPFSISEPLAFVQVLAFAVLIAAVTVLWIFVMIAVYAWVIKPFVDWATKPQGGFFRRVALWPLRKTAELVDSFTREHIAALKRYVAANLRPLVQIQLQTAEMVNRVAGTLGDMSEQTYDAFYALRHVTVPNLIAAALVPVKAQLTRHTGRLDDLEDLNRRVAVEVGDTLRALPWGVPGGYVTNWQTFLGRFVQLWNHYWDVTRAQIETLLTDTLPGIRQDISDLSRRLDVQIDARLDALGNRISDLERWRENVASPALDALRQAVDLLNEQVFEPVGGGLTSLLERVIALEQAVAETIPQRFAQVEAELVQLRADLLAGIATGLGVFEERIVELERIATVEIPQRLDAMQLAIDTLAGEVFTEVGAGLNALTARVVAIETWVFGELRTMVELAVGRIEALEADVRDNVLPRLRAIEGLLAPAAFAALVVATMRQVAPNLFCRNTTAVTQRICGLDETMLLQLLAGTLGFALLLDPRLVARTGQAVEGTIEYAYRTMAGL